MKRRTLISKAICMGLIAGMVLSLAPATVKADNPIVQTNYTADPAPLVVGDEIYVFTTHDEDIIEMEKPTDGYLFYTMKEWRCYSSKDMVNWTDHGTMLDRDDITWGHKRAWAAQCIERNGKFYLYFPIVMDPSEEGYGIGVGVADKPEGPYTPPAEPLLIGNWTDIDPTVWIDDDGQAYLYFGQTLKYVKLNEDMVSYDKSFGIKNVNTSSLSYTEGPWLYKHNDQRYLIYPGADKSGLSGGGGQAINYSTSDSFEGQWTFGGTFMKSGECFTNHPGLVDFKEKTYLFYHTNALDNTTSYHRSVCIDEVTFSDDGKINMCDATNEGIEPIAAVNPYERVEAETICLEGTLATPDPSAVATPVPESIIRDGVKTGGDNVDGMYVYKINNDDYIKVRNVDFGSEGAVKFVASAAGGKGNIEVRLDSEDGSVAANLPITGTDNENTWKEFSVNCDKITGAHDLFFVFKGEGSDEMFKYDYWKFENEAVATPVPSASSTPTTPVVTTAPVATPTAAPTIVPVVSTPVKELSIAKASFKSVTNIKPKTVVLKLKKVADAKGYEVTLATNSKFTKAKIVKTIKSTTLKIKKLKKGKTYYMKCRAYGLNASGNKVFGKFSKTAKLKIKR